MVREIRILSYTFSHGSSESSWDTNPINLSFLAFSGAVPQTVTNPSLGLREPAANLSRGVFPTPLLPMTDTISPLATENETSDTTGTFELFCVYETDTPEQERIDSNLIPSQLKNHQLKINIILNT